MRQKPDGSWDGKMGRNQGDNITPIKGPGGPSSEDEVDKWVEGLEQFDWKSCKKSMCIKPKK